MSQQSIRNQLLVLCPDVIFFMAQLMKVIINIAILPVEPPTVL